MKLLMTGLLASAAVAAAQEQQVLQAEGSAQQQPAPSIFDETLKQFESGLEEGITHFWSEMKTNFKHYLPLISVPKEHTRRADSEWDHVVRGADVESVWVQGANGEKHREIDGKLQSYDLRVKAVDPAELGIDPGVKQYSGYLDDNETDKHLFYWFFESRNDPKNDPVVLWLNGGPGCSSLTGLFLELGPATIDKNLKIVPNPYSWNSNASVIFLDQPVNVGFSYSGSSVSDTVAAGKDIYALLTLFFKQFPEYATQDFHISGESYAGHYIPVFASEILSHKNTNINLKSVLIGNGLTDPLTQYPQYRPMACGDGGYPAVLDQGTCRSMDNSLERCLSLIETCYSSESAWVCVPAAMYCNSAIIGPYQQTGMNPYDVRSKCEDMSSLCYPQLNTITEWLNQKSVMKALGVEVESYESCNGGINRDFLFHGDWMKPYHRLVPSLLEKIPVLIYAGDADFICNWLGNLAWTNALEWPGHKKFAEAKMNDLKVVDNKSKGKKIGQVKSSGNFTFMRIFGAGHMVPLNQPEASLEFFNRWLRGEWH
ncbi:putative carboxypeptidase C [Microsporum ferrugineum]